MLVLVLLLCQILCCSISQDLPLDSTTQSVTLKIWSSSYKIPQVLSFVFAVLLETVSDLSLGDIKELGNME